MADYETITTVGGLGDIHLVGVPFQPGTEVEVVVTPKKTNGEPVVDADQRLTALLSALDHAHNAEPIGSLRREELYDRDVVR
ncbi:MAG: hypothetical protein L0228_17830 [Planctomycetes bacterium]|nr:hypothetical protein [Planctomycetota bacterium]